MKSADSEWSALLAHAPHDGDAVHTLAAQVEVSAGAILAFRYRLVGDIARLRIPPETVASRADDLWKHTCFEAFVRERGGSNYWEMNFAPSRQWAFYGFDAYRAGRIDLALKTPPRIAVERSADRLEVEASVQLAGLFAAPGTRQLEIGLSAVVEDARRTLSYWALKHPAATPDFHHAEGFVLKVTA